MSFSQNALNSEKIKSQQDIDNVRIAYKAQLQSQININKTKRITFLLLNLTDSLPHEGLVKLIVLIVLYHQNLTSSPTIL